MDTRRWRWLLGGGWILFGAFVGLSGIVNLFALAYDPPRNMDPQSIAVTLWAEAVIGPVMFGLGFAIRYDQRWCRIPAIILSLAAIAFAIYYPVWLTEQALALGEREALLVLAGNYLIALAIGIGAGLTIWTYLRKS